MRKLLCGLGVSAGALALMVGGASAASAQSDPHRESAQPVFVADAYDAAFCVLGTYGGPGGGCRGGSVVKPMLGCAGGAAAGALAGMSVGAQTGTPVGAGAGAAIGGAGGCASGLAATL